MLERQKIFNFLLTMGRVEIKGPSKIWLYRQFYNIVIEILPQKSIYMLLLIKKFLGRGQEPLPRPLPRYFNDKNATKYQVNIIRNKLNNQTVSHPWQSSSLCTITYLCNSEKVENQKYITLLHINMASVLSSGLTSIFSFSNQWWESDGFEFIVESNVISIYHH